MRMRVKSITRTESTWRMELQSLGQDNPSINFSAGRYVDVMNAFTTPSKQQEHFVYEEKPSRRGEEARAAYDEYQDQMEIVTDVATEVLLDELRRRFQASK